MTDSSGRPAGRIRRGARLAVALAVGWSARVGVVLLGLAVFMWVRSYFAEDLLVVQGPSSDVTHNPVSKTIVWSGSGQVIGYLRATASFAAAGPRPEGYHEPASVGWTFGAYPPGNKYSGTLLRGLVRMARDRPFAWREEQGRAPDPPPSAVVRDYHEWTLGFPWAAVAAAAGTAPAAAGVVGWRRWRRERYKAVEPVWQRLRRWAAREAWNAAGGVSALLLLVVVAGWARSYRATPYVERLQTYAATADGWQLHSAVVVGWPRGRVTVEGWGEALTPPGVPDGRVPLGSPDYGVAEARAGSPPVTADMPWSRPAAGFLGITFRRETVPFQLPPAGPGVAAPTRYTSQWELTVPSWTLALSLAVLPALAVRAAVRRARRRRRSATGLCVDCGYDLRGTPGRCPECGRVPGEDGG